jgi:hypothetical protein
MKKLLEGKWKIKIPIPLIDSCPEVTLYHIQKFEVNTLVSKDQL